MYRLSSGNVPTIHLATLDYLGTNISTYAGDRNYGSTATSGRGYFKVSNVSQNDWSDIIGLMQGLAMATNTASDAIYSAAVRQVVNVEQWMRNIALFQLLGSGETAFQTGRGDDYAMYRGINDPRFILLCHDWDTVLNQGSGPAATNRNLFMMCPFSGSGSDEPVLNRFMTNAAFVPLYYGAFLDMMNGSLSVSNVSLTLDRLLGDWVLPTPVFNMKYWYTNRVSWIRTQMPLNLTVIPSLTTNNGYLYTTSPTISLGGAADIVNTRSVTVNGSPATWTAWLGIWTNTTVALQPGINRVVIESRDTNGLAFASTNIDIWYDATGTSVSGALSGSVLWSAAGGPWRVTGNVTVGNGATLTIEPGASVFFASGTTLTVSGSGKILANGTATQHIRLTRVPGTANWGSLDFIGATNESKLVYVDFEYCGGTTIGGHNAQVHVNGASKVFIDHCTWPPTPVIEYISFDGSSFIVQNCIFPTFPPPTGPESLHGINGIPTGGYGIFRDNYFGHTWGFNDTIDFTGGNRPGPILQIINNVFDGASDDCLDLDSTDAWIEGNIFMHVHRDPARTDNALDTGSAISGGVDTVGQNSDWTIINNLFYDVDHVFLNKGNSTTTGNGGGRIAFLYNTVVHVAKEYSGSTQAEIAAFDWSDDSIALPDPSLGSGMYAAYNIIYDCPVLQHFYNPTNHTVIFENNILANSWTGAGTNNRVIDPMLNLGMLAGTFPTNVTVAQLRLAAQLLPGSPALGAGFGGLNLGGLQPHGIVLSGWLAGTTASNSASLLVGPSGTFNWGSIATQPWGWVAYKWKLDHGQWSSEILVTNNSPFTNPAAIKLSGLSAGPHTLYVVGKNDAGPGYYQDDTFVYPAGAGIPARVTAPQTWFVMTNTVLLRINEVLAKNDTAVPVNGQYPDLIELYNAGSAAVDLSGMSLTDDPTAPQKYVFPSGASIGVGQYLVLYADNEVQPLGYHLGFGLAREGGGVYLFTAGGQLLDSVAYGLQISDRSIGRLADGHWALCSPTFGAANVAVSVGDPDGLKINEWMAHGLGAIPYDYIELFNPAALPVALGGLYLTPNVIGAPAQHPIAALSFIPASGYALFIADGHPATDPTHLTFTLSGDRGVLGLLDQNLAVIDYVFYGPQQTDVSQGRSPNGSTNLVFFTTPTPGAPNRAPVPPGGQLVINEVMAKNINGLTNIDGGTPEWIELYNPTATTVILADMSLTDTTDTPRKWVFPAGATLGTGRYLVVVFDTSQPASTNLSGLYLNTGFALLASGGGVHLYDKGVGGAWLDGLTYGVQANDYSVGRVPSGSTNWVLSLPTPGSLNLLAQLGDPTQLRLNEWMGSNPNGSDWFEIYNPNTQPVSLGRLYLTDDLRTPASRQKFTIAPLSFIGNGLYGYAQFWADKNPAAGLDHVNFKIKAGGGSLGLTAPGDLLIDSVNYGSQQAGVSEGRLPDGGANIVRFPVSATPGDANYLPLTNLVVNEVLTAIPSNAPFEQAIELLNTSGADVNIGGWYLSNQKHTLQKYRIPNGTVVPARGFKVFYENQFNFDPHDSSAFRLDAVNGDQVYLAMTGTNGSFTGYRAEASFGAADPGVSFGRYTNSVGTVDFPALTRTTFGADEADRVEDFRAGTGANNAYPVVGPIVLTEIMYRPPDFPGGVNNVRDEFMEWQNISSNTVRLYDPANPQNTWHVRGGLSYDFPTNVSLAPGAFLLVVSFDPVNDTNARAGFLAAYPQLAGNAVLYGPYSGALGNTGDTVDLNKPGTPVAGAVPRILVEHVTYDQNAPWDIGANGMGYSLQRLYLALYGNDPANWEAATPTPGSVYNANPDTDGDGIPDAWIENYFGHSEGQTADNSMWWQDADGDGMNNLQEYQAGTNPRDPNSTLKLTMQLTPTNLSFSFEGVMAKSYAIKTSGALSGSWSNVVIFDPLPASGPVSFSTTAPSLGAPPQFYRVVIPTSP
ncbi:MAG: lamin tail domain-containing protein [Verrucomicrobia bacterium]|nr:lamin tail domain-containing protein [Verrucomicrobiota bacterium]